MKLYHALSWALIACCMGLFRLAFMNALNLSTIMALLAVLIIATVLLLPLTRRWPVLTRRASALSTLVAGIVGWFVVLPLVLLLLIVPFPQRWAVFGIWRTEAAPGEPQADYQRTFSPFGTTTTSINGELNSTGHSLFLDEQTLQIDWSPVPSRFTVGPQRDVYTIELQGDTLTLSWMLTKKTTVYHRYYQ